MYIVTFLALLAFHPFGVDKLSSEQLSVPVAPSGECSRG